MTPAQAAREEWPKLSPGVVVACLVLMAWTSSLLPGFAFPWGNNVFHVPIVLDYAGSVEGPHDAITRGLDNFVSAFWPLLGLFANEHNIFWVFFAAHVLARLLFMAGVYGLVREAGGSQKASLVLTGLAGIAPIFKGLSTVGQTETLATYLSHTEFAIAMLPGCWWLLVRGRWIGGAFAMGLIFNINAFIAIWSAVAAAVAVGIGGTPRPLLRCGAAYLVAALPTLIWILSTLAQPAQPMDFRKFLLEYYPFHTFVHVQWGAVARYGSFLLAAAVAVRFALTELSAPARRILVPLTVGYVVVFLIGVPLPYLTGSSLLLNLYPLRIDAVINVAVVSILLGWAANSLWSGPERRGLLPFATALAVLTGNMVAALLLLHSLATARDRRSDGRIASLALCVTVALLILLRVAPTTGVEFVPVSILFCAMTLAAAAADREQGSGPDTLSALTLALVCSFLPQSQAFPWPQVGLAVVVIAKIYGFRRLWPLGFVLAAVTCLWIAEHGTRMPLVAAVAVTLAGVGVAMAGHVGAGAIVRKAVSPVPVLAGLAALGIGLSALAGWRGSFERPDAPLTAERESQSWARRNIPPDTPLLEVGFSGFSVMSRRPSWVDEQAGATVMWKPAYLSEWRSRMAQIRACADAGCFAQLARRHDIHWIVAARGRMPDARDAGLRLRFANQKYEIYSLADDRRPGSQGAGGVT